MGRVPIFGRTPAPEWRSAVVAAVKSRDGPRLLELLKQPGSRERLHAGLPWGQDATFARLCVDNGAPEMLDLVCIQRPSNIGLSDCCLLRHVDGLLEVTSEFDLLQHCIDAASQEFLSVALRHLDDKAAKLADRPSEYTLHAAALRRLMTNDVGELAAPRAAVCKVLLDERAPVADSWDQYPGGLTAPLFYGHVAFPSQTDETLQVIADLLPSYLQAGYVYIDLPRDDHQQLAPVVQAAQNGNGPLAAKLIELGCQLPQQDLVEVARAGKVRARADATAAAIASALMARGIGKASAPNADPPARRAARLV